MEPGPPIYVRIFDTFDDEDTVRKLTRSQADGKLTDMMTDILKLEKLGEVTCPEVAGGTITEIMVKPGDKVKARTQVYMVRLGMYERQVTLWIK